MRGLNGKVAFITGGAKNIGKAISLRLAREGVAVMMAGRDTQSAERLADEIVREGGKAGFVRCDLSNPASAADAIAATVDKFGGIDILVNNAAATHLIRGGNEHSIVDEPLDTFDDFMKVGVYGPFLLAKAAIPAMVGRGGGVFVNISSMAAGHGQIGSTVYGPSKAALESLTNQIAANYGPQGVRAVAIRVGLIRTDENRMLHDHAVVGPMLRDSQMLKRSGETDDVANAVAFLASDEASFITGTILTVDGGVATMQHIPDVSKVFAAERERAEAAPK